MFSNKWRAICVALYAGFVLLGLSTGGLPSDLSEFFALFVIPALTFTFMYFFYKGVANRAKRLGGSVMKRTKRTDR